VIGAHEQVDVPILLATDSRTSMAAHIVKCMDRVLPVTNDDEVFFSNGKQEVVTGIRDYATQWSINIHCVSHRKPKSAANMAASE